ncbi:MAG: hypothetical protein JW797_06465 [Bradymonadales bacterium]|nr:hypothetical protein [Bradymonadales bacterium]
MFAPTKPRWIRLVASLMAAQLILVLLFMVQDFATERHVFDTERRLFVHSVTLDDAGQSPTPWSEEPWVDPGTSQPLVLLTQELCLFLLFVTTPWAHIENDSGPKTSPVVNAVRPFLRVEWHADPLTPLALAPKHSPPLS